jgi:hypothetical protein
VFDAFFTIYVKRTADLMRIARAGGAISPSGDVHPDLAKRLAEAAAKDAERFLNICIRALDYCPPIDIRFGDFLRALVTADYDLVPDDTVGYRSALIDAFRARGIAPEGVASFSEEALRWCAPELLRGQYLPKCEGLLFDVFASDHTATMTASDKARMRTQSEANAAVLWGYAKRHADVLGLSPDYTISARTFHTVHRVGPDGRVDFNMVAELMQRASRQDNTSSGSTDAPIFRGGTTIILARDGTVRYAIMKPLGNPHDVGGNERLARQTAYQELRESSLALSCYQEVGGLSSPLSFANVHRGY